MQWTLVLSLEPVARLGIMRTLLDNLMTCVCMGALTFQVVQDPHSDSERLCPGLDCYERP
eukprot:706680-Amphidinium_carterae.1